MALLGTSRTLSSGLRMLNASISPMRVGSCGFSTRSIAAMTATTTTTTTMQSFTRANERTLRSEGFESRFTQSTTTTGTTAATTPSTANRSMSGMSAAASMTENFKKFSYYSGLKQTVKSDLKQMTDNIVSRVGSNHPVLTTLSKYYFEQMGKRIRPLIVILISRALNNHRSKANNSLELHPKQLQLAEIVEMIHTASLIHDDIIDNASTRRGVKTINEEHGSKMAVLSGDFLLARASVSLAQLRNHEVTELMASVIANLVEGEFIQMKPTDGSFETYITKTYLKTASLIANGCRCAAILGDLPRDIVDHATDFGRNLGIAFQLIDDLLDFVESADSLGKPAAVDLELGLAIAPVLYALEEFPELKPLIERKFSQEGDVEKVRKIVGQSQGIFKTKQLAEEYAANAVKALSYIDDSEARSALNELAAQVLLRRR